MIPRRVMDSIITGLGKEIEEQLPSGVGYFLCLWDQDDTSDGRMRMRTTCERAQLKLMLAECAEFIDPISDAVEPNP